MVAGTAENEITPLSPEARTWRGRSSHGSARRVPFVSVGVLPLHRARERAFALPRRTVPCRVVGASAGRSLPAKAR